VGIWDYDEIVIMGGYKYEYNYEGAAVRECSYLT